MVISTLEKRVAELEAQVLQNSKAAVKDALEGRVKSLEEHVHKVARKSVDEQVSRIDEKLGEKNKEQQSMLMEKMQTIASKAAEKGVKSVERNLYVKVSDANQEHFERVASLTGGWKTWLSGDVGLLAGATALERIYLGWTSVWGSVEPLAALTQLTFLRLQHADVYGDATVLRAIPGLGAGWPTRSSQASLCSAFAGSCPAGSSAIADAATFVGNDACACCTAVTGLARDAAGVCINTTVG